MPQHNPSDTLNLRLLAALLLVLYAVFMIATNHRLTILDDEATIITVANTSVAQTLQTFLHGAGQHEHPPLSDLLLHGWLVLTHRSFEWLRVFPLLFYMGGLCVLAKCGQLLGNKTTAWSVLLLGTLWPFGYFYARITGWYCVCFLLVSLLLLCYFLLLRHGSPRHWAGFALVSVLLVWSNYYGIAILFLLLADMLLLHLPFAKKHLTALAITCVAVVLSFLPLLHALLADAHGTVRTASVPLTHAAEKIGFMLFTLLASVAVAPWFLPWSIPAGIAAVCLFLCLLSNQSSRVAVCHFLLLILGLSLSSHLDLKRLLFLTPWLILALALGFSTRHRPQALTIAASLVIFAIGWLGIATGRHPATSNFYEPWQTIAAASAIEAQHGTVLISDSPTYFFYLNYALGLQAVPATNTYLGPAAYQDQGVAVLRNVIPAKSRLASMSNVLVVRGVAPRTEMASLDATISQLSETCKLQSSSQSTPDPAFNYKPFLEPEAPLANFRVALSRFDCRRVPK